MKNTHWCEKSFRKLAKALVSGADPLNYECAYGNTQSKWTQDVIAGTSYNLHSRSHYGGGLSNLRNSFWMASISGAVDRTVEWWCDAAPVASTRTTSTTGGWSAGRWNGPALSGRTSGDADVLPQARRWVCCGEGAGCGAVWPLIVLIPAGPAVSGRWTYSVLGFLVSERIELRIVGEWVWKL